MVERLRERIADGEYDSLDEIVGEALREFEAEEKVADDPAFVAWFKREVVPAIEANRRDPARRLTADQVLANLATARERRALNR